MNLFQFTLALGLLFPFLLFGQNTDPHFGCAADEAMAQFYLSHPEKLAEQKMLEQAIYEKMNSGQEFSPPPYTLPVVVHVIHQNGAENIPDAQIETAIAQLNEAFSHSGYYGGQGNGHDAQIQFCLAKQDPDGNASNGITRHNSPLTNMILETQDLAMKDLARWEPLEYINIYVVNSITSNSSGPGVAGYAFFPTSHGMPEDGLVVEAQFFGTTPSENAVLIHEMGHYLNLFHTFQGGCGNGDCLMDGDRVCDTPPDQTTFSACNANTCDTDLDDTSANNPLTADVADLTENYMDYSPFDCYHAFTPGQAERMYAAIDMVRFSLLDSKGCFDPCTLPVTIDFTASATEVFAGQTVNFTNNSTGATIFEWSVDGVVFASSANASFTFNDIGIFEVELFVTNADANCFERPSIFITVKCGVVPDFMPSNSTVAVGESFVATNTSQNATDYEWYLNGVLVSTDTDLNYIFNSEGIYTLVLVATDGACTNQTSTTVTVVSGEPCPDSVAGFYYDLQDDWLFFGDMLPNGDFFLNYYFPFQSNDIGKFDVNGNLLWQRKIDVVSNAITDLGIHAMPDGGCIGATGTGNLGDMNLFKFDENGNLDWVVNTTEGFILKLPDGVMVISEDPIQQHLKFIRFDLNGNELWNKIYALDTDGFHIEHACLSADGNHAWVAGYGGVSPINGVTISKLDLTSGDIVLIRKFYTPDNPSVQVPEIIPTQDNGFFLLGNAFLDGSQVGLLMKGDEDGFIEWTRIIDWVTDPSNEGPYFAYQTMTGNYWVSYSQSLPSKSFWLSLTANGDFNFIRELKRDNGEIFFLRFAGELNGVPLAWAKEGALNDKIFFAEVSETDGLDIGCVELIESTETFTDIDFLVEEYVYNLTTLEVPVDDSALPITTSTAQVIKTPFCSFEIDCPEICDNGLDDDGDGYVDCFDIDCDCSDGEDCEAEEPPVNNFSAQVAWRSPNEEASTLATPMVANLDPQNGPMPEIIVQRGDSNTPGNVTPFLHFFNGDGSNQANPVVLEVQGGIAVNPVSPPAIGDVNGDGIPEVIMVCGDERIRAYTNYDPTANPPMELWATSDVVVWERRAIPALADFDADGTAEVLVGNDVFRFDLSNPSSPGLVRVLDGNGDFGRLGYGNTNIPGASSVTTAADVLTVNDCGGDPDCEGLEVLAGRHIYSVDLDLFDGDGMEIKIQRDLSLMDPVNAYLDGYTVTADVNLDGFLDVIVTSRRGAEMGMYVYDKNGAIGWFPYPNNTASYVSIAAVANVYDDTVDGHPVDLPEIICVSAFRMTAFNLNALSANPAQPYHWTLTTNDNSGYTGVAIFDFNGDGTDEICYRDPNQFRIIYGGPAPFPPGVSFNRNWMAEPNVSATYGEAPVVADCDADGEAEIIFTGKLPGNTNFTYTEGNLWVMESADQPWVACRPVWNQYGYFGVNVNDDLTIPASQQAHHLEFPGLGSGNRPFNRFLAQMPILDEDYNPFYPVPDATLVVDSTQCEGDSVRVWLTVCNEGSNGLPANMPIVFYDSDPTAVVATPLSFPVELGSALVPGDCQNLEVVIPAQYNSPVHVVANVDWFFPTPFDPLTDFPTTDIIECDYENNFAEFTELSGSTNPPDLGPDIVLCNSSVVTLDAGGPYDSYAWQDGSVEQTFTAYLPGTYWVTVQSGCGQPLSDTIEIILDQSAVLDLGPDLTLCPGESAELTVSGFDEVTWWPEEGLDCLDCPTVNASPTDTITYYATGQNGDCFSTDSVQIFVEEFSLEIDVAQDGCDTVATLTAVVMGNGTYDYLWSIGEPIGEITITQSGGYEVTVTSQPGLCELADTVAIDLGSLLVESEVTPVECANDATGAIDLTPTGGEPPFEFLWENGADTEDLDGLTSGQYTVTVTDATGCSAELEFEIPATADFTVELMGDTLVNPDLPFQLVAEISPPDAVLDAIVWQPDGLPPQLSVNVMITEETLFTITVTDTSGCAATDDLLLRLIRPGNNVYFPNVIHPNSPNGENLAFTGFGGEGVTLIRSLKIFDRWGGLVFDGENLPPNDTSMGWDGTSDGDPVNQGVYVFLAEVEFSDGEVMQVSGDVMVIR